MITFREALADTEDALIAAQVYCGHGYESEHDESVALVLAAAGLPDETGAEILDQTMPETALERLAGFVRQRTIERFPVAYITGWAWLGPLRFRADDRALVPRSPLMAVIDHGFAPWWKSSVPNRIVDVCCGGGSLGLIAAQAFPDSDVWLLDIDDRALSLAQENLELHAPDNVKLVKADLLEPLAPNSVDIIMANPPYVDASDMASLPPEYLHEPRLALAAGEDGLDLVHRLLLQAAEALTPDGIMLLEVGNSWYALERAYPAEPFTWLQFETGGHGVCVLDKPTLNRLSTRAREHITPV